MSTKTITILKRDYSNHCSTNTPVPLCSGNMETDDSSKNKLELQEALMEEKEENQYLASQNAALKEQMATKELSWEKEKRKLMKALESPRTNPNQAHMWRMVKKKEQQIRSLEKDLQEQVMETKRVTQHWKGEYDRVTAFWKEENDRITKIWEDETETIKAASYKDLLAMSAEWEQRWHVQQEEVFTQMEALREEMDKKVNQVILEKDDLITKLTNEKKVLEAQCAESSAKLKEKELGVNLELIDSQAEWNTKHQSLQENKSELKETSAEPKDKTAEIIQREAEWQAKYKALEDQLKCEVAEKEASFKRVQELERKGRKEEEGLHKEENGRITEIWENETKVIKAASDKDLLAVSAEWEQWWHVQQEEVFTQMESLRDEMDKKVNQVILEKDDLITKITNEKKVLEAQCAESSAKLKEKELGVNLELIDSQAEWNTKHQSLQENKSELKETSAEPKDKTAEIIQREAEWQAKYKALEDQLKCEVAEKEASFKRVQELERKGRKEEEGLHKEENGRITEIWENETKVIKAASDKDLLAVSAEWEQWWHVQQEEVFTQMESLREEMDKKVNQVILEKDDLITKITNEKKVLEAQCAESSAKLREKEQEFMDSQAEWNTDYQSLQEINRKMNQFILENDDLIIYTINEQDILEAELKETSAKLEDKETEITQREVEWQAKYKALEDQLKCEVAEKEAGLKRMQELEREGRKEEEWLHKATQMEENIKLLTQRNNELQELALMTDKDKAKIKKEAKKAKKEAEKKLKKQRKEREEREKKERKENEKKERERLEREKKEQKLREGKEKEKAKRWMRGD